MKEVTRFTGNKCPHCGKHLDAASGYGQAKPDDYTICLYCTSISQFNEDMTMRAVPHDEIPDHVRKEREAFLNFKKIRDAQMN